jgi:hypothetical protein
MARGFKTGGRKKGTPNRLTAKAKEILEAADLSPLEHMLAVMRDPNADRDERLTAAKAAAPYCHRALKAIEHTGEGGGPIQHKVTLSFD